MITSAYRPQVDLLLRILPQIAKEKTFALKGGTAINLFVYNMPRFSVDIDLTYLPFDERTTALQNIASALAHIRQDLETAIPGIRVSASRPSEYVETRMICQLQQALVKVEVNTTMRGHLWPPRTMQLVQSAQDEFSKFAIVPVVSEADLFGGKICAALDRQHPRDLFDIYQLFVHKSFTNDIRQGLIVALLSHPRPVHEIIQPNFQDQQHIFTTQFTGMTIEPFFYADFEATRKRLVQEVHARLTDADRSLLLSFTQGEPDWSLFPHKKLKDLPAVQWKLTNIQKLKKQNPRKHIEQLNKLQQELSR